VINAVSGWFAEMSAGNLHLSSNGITEVIDQGTDITELTDDFDSESRPQGAGIDIGADEYYPIGINSNGNDNIIPEGVELFIVPSNQLNGIITIGFYLSIQEEINLSVYNIKGKLITMFFSGMEKAGKHSITWSTTNKSCGVYLCMLEMPDKGVLKTAKVILVRK
jgi:hypothetical protein